MRPDVHPQCGRHAFRLVASIVAGLLLTAVPARAHNLCPTGIGDCVVDHNITITAPNATFALGSRAFIVRQWAGIPGEPGPCTLHAGCGLLEQAAKSLAPDSGSGPGTTVTITSASTIRLLANVDGSRPAKIDVHAEIEGGQIDLTAAGNIQIDGQLDARALQAGFGGTINLHSSGG